MQRLLKSKTSVVLYLRSVLWKRPGARWQCLRKNCKRHYANGTDFAVKWSNRKWGAGLILSCSPFSAAKLYSKNPERQEFKCGDLQSK